MGRRSTSDSNGFVCDPREGHAALALKLSRMAFPEKSLGAEDTLELGHHLLKANLFRNNAKDLQASWLTMASNDTTSALAHRKNIASPNVKVSRYVWKILLGIVFEFNERQANMKFWYDVMIYSGIKKAFIFWFNL